MIRTFSVPVALLAALAAAAPTFAQVTIRAPFVRVQTGGPYGGVHVQAPFTNVFVPPSMPAYYPPAYYPPPTPVVPPNGPNGVPQGPIISKPFDRVPAVPEGEPVPTLPPPRLDAAPPGGVAVPQKIIHSPGRPLTHVEFARIFQPIPGTHEVDLIHPGHKGNVVRVCFTLPPGCPKVRVNRRSLEFDYGDREVEIRFALFGNVRVEYND